MTDSDPPRFRLVPSTLYSEKKAKLIGEQLEQVEQAERAIERDPNNGTDRRPDIHGGWIDYSPWPSGSMIRYRADLRPDHEGEIELVDLVAFDLGPQRRVPPSED